jgi:hypothetical protein
MIRSMTDDICTKIKSSSIKGISRKALQDSLVDISVVFSNLIDRLSDCAVELVETAGSLSPQVKDMLLCFRDQTKGTGNALVKDIEDRLRALNKQQAETNSPNWTDIPKSRKFNFDGMFDFEPPAQAQKKSTPKSFNPFADDFESSNQKATTNMSYADSAISRTHRLSNTEKTPGLTATNTGGSGSPGTSFQLEFVSEIRQKFKSFSDPVEQKIRALRLTQLSAIGDECVSSNFNYHLYMVGTEDFFLSGHDQMVKFNKFTNTSRVIKHGIPLVYFYSCHRQWDLYFSRNEEVVLVNGTAKKSLSQKFRGTYCGDKFDMRGRGVCIVGCLLYFQALPTDLVVYNLDLLLTSFNSGTSYEGEVIALDVECFVIDQSCKVWTISSKGRILKVGSQVGTTINTEPHHAILFTCLSKHKSHLIASSFSDKQKDGLLYLVGEHSCSILDLFCLQRQTSHVHQMRFLEAESHPILIACTFYTVNLMAVIQDRLVPLDIDQAPAENMLNHIEFDEFSRTLYVVDTRRLIKVFTII